MTFAIGVDVGATKIAAAFVDVERGAIAEARRLPTAPQRGSDAVRADCRALVAELSGAAERYGDSPRSRPRECYGDSPRSTVPVGLAVCELVGRDGSIRSAETVDWRGADLSDTFDRVESDVRAAALAEARYGAGRDEPDFLYVSVGSGISHCLMTAHGPRLGVRGAAIGTGAPLVERWSSGLALARRTGHESAEDALADPRAAGIVDDAAQRLGVTLAALVNALDPGAVIVGGGLGLHDGYRERVEHALRAAIYDADARGLPVLPAALRADAPVIGAALAAAARARA